MTNNMIDHIKAIHKDIRKSIFSQLRKKWFLITTYTKLKLKKYDPFRILQQIVDNVYLIELLDEFDMSITFIDSDILKYSGNCNKYSRMNYLHRGDTDAA